MVSSPIMKPIIALVVGISLFANGQTADQIARAARAQAALIANESAKDRKEMDEWERKQLEEQEFLKSQEKGDKAQVAAESTEARKDVSKKSVTLRELRLSLPLKKKQEVIVSRDIETADVFSCIYRTKEGQTFEFFDMTEEEHAEFAKALIDDADQKKVTSLSREMLVEISNTQKNPDEQKYLDASPMFTRALVIALSGAKNRVLRSPEEMDSLNRICLRAMAKSDEQTKAQLMNMYSVVVVLNRKVGEIKSTDK